MLFRSVSQSRYKDAKIIYADAGSQLTKTIETTEQERQQSVLSDGHILELARMVATIEDYYSTIKNAWSPMDVEWAQDGDDGKLYIVQARPETVHGASSMSADHERYQLKENDPQALTAKHIVVGQSIGQRICSGVARVIMSPKDIDQVQEGDILVTQMTDPDWVPIMKKAVVS